MSGSIRNLTVIEAGKTVFALNGFVDANGRSVAIEGDPKTRVIN